MSQKVEVNPETKEKSYIIPQNTPWISYILGLPSDAVKINEYKGHKFDCLYFVKGLFYTPSGGGYFRPYKTQKDKYVTVTDTKGKRVTIHLSDFNVTIDPTPYLEALEKRIEAEQKAKQELH